MAYDLQKILLDNYCNKHGIETSKRELINGNWFYWLKMEWCEIHKEFKYASYITALFLFPERFGLEDEVSDQSQFYPREY